MQEAAAREAGQEERVALAAHFDVFPVPLRGEN
jgi:hypothetical protein